MRTKLLATMMLGAALAGSALTPAPAHAMVSGNGLGLNGPSLNVRHHERRPAEYWGHERCAVERADHEW